MQTELKAEIECTRVRKCKWRGRFSELVQVPSKRYGQGVTDGSCPRCGGKEFYRVKESEAGDAN